MNPQQPPADKMKPQVDESSVGAPAGLRRGAVGAGWRPPNFPPLSFNVGPDPFLEPGPEIRRRRQQRKDASPSQSPDETPFQQHSGPSARPAAEAAPVGFRQAAPPDANPPGQIGQPITDLLASLRTSLGANPGLLSDVGRFLLNALQSLHADPKPLGDLAQCIAGLLASPQGAGAAASPVAGSPGPDVYQATVPESNPKTQQVNTDEMVRILAGHSAIVFDGRTRLEYAIGHLPGALSLSPNPDAPKSRYVGDVAEVARLVPDRNAPLVLYCNGPFCGKSRRLAEDLVTAGYTNVRRYQLGTPVWRALVGPMEIELEGIRYIRKGDQTAVFLDARGPEEFASGSLPGARHVLVNDLAAAKSDGRLPMDDFNTRIITFGQDGTEALGLAEALVHTGFNNVKFYGGGFASLLMGL